MKNVESTNILLINGKPICTGEYDTLLTIVDQLNHDQNVKNEFIEVSIKPVVIRSSMQVLKGMTK
jgi:hypothetical protein